MDKIIYDVNDIFDIEIFGNIGSENFFLFVGINIEFINYVLNLYGFIGYFDFLKNV